MSIICATCRFWSELLVQSPQGVTRAMCANALSPRSMDFTAARDTCGAWQQQSETNDGKAIHPHPRL